MSDTPNPRCPVRTGESRYDTYVWDRRCTQSVGHVTSHAFGPTYATVEAAAKAVVASSYERAEQRKLGRIVEALAYAMEIDRQEALAVVAEDCS